MTTYTRVRARFTAYDVVYCGMFAALMMIGANITSFMPFMVVGGVPITLQAFFAILAGLVLGSKRGAIAVAVYACVGLAGAPVFARFSGGISQLLSPTFGFIIVFILSAYIAGKMIEVRSTKAMYVAAGLVAMMISYLLGTNWLYAAYKLWAAAPEGFSYWMAWAWMLPPLPKDIVLAILAGLFAFRLRHVIKVVN